MSTDTSQEFRLKSGSTLLEYIRRFSATEKAVFGILVLIAGIAALFMASRVNNLFMVEIPGFDGSLTEGAVGLPHTVNPVLAVTDVDRDLSQLIYSGLTKYKDGNIVPDLATFTVSDDGLTYTFTLKNNIHFQDGLLLTTDDVAYTIQKIQDAALKSPRRGDWQNVGIKVVSPTIIQFILKQPYGPFLSNTTVGIIPKHLWGALSDEQFPLSEYNVEPVGSGPYRESSIGRTSGGIPDSYKLSAWSGYYGDKPHLATLTFDFFADNEKALSALDSGSIDSLSTIAPSDAKLLASDSAQPYKVIAAPLPRVFGVFFNQSQQPILADKNIRAALNMVIDRQMIIKQALDGYGVAIDSPLPLGTQVASTTATATDASIIPQSVLASARNLIERSGWRLDPSTRLYEMTKKGSKTVQELSFDMYTADTPDLKETADILKQTWAALGVDVNVKVFESADLYQDVIRTRKYDALLFGESVGKDRDLYAFWDSSQRNPPGLNIALYANSKVDKLLEDIRSTSDDGVRAAKYAQFVSLIKADVPAVFLYVPDFTYAVPKSLHGITLTSMTIPSDRFTTINDWYDTTDKVWSIFAKN